MSEQRDELAELIANAEYPNMDPPWSERKDRSPVKWYSRKYADAVIADGWTKPRTITTVEELDALPVGSVVLVRRRAWTRFEPKQVAGALVEIHKWMCPDGGILRADSDQDIILPATVLYEPTA